MQNDLKQVKAAIDEIGSGYRAAKVFSEITGYNMSAGTMNRVYKGEAKPAMIAFVRFAFERGKIS